MINSAFTTHRPVLYKILSLINNKPILELGCGDGSTDIIHKHAVQNNAQITTIESDKIWLEKYNYCKHELHELIHIENFSDWMLFLTNKKVHWGLVFIDQGSWESRKECLMYLKDKADYIILHDSCYYPKNNIFGKCTTTQQKECCSFKFPDRCPCLSNIKNFERTYDDVFLYSKEYISPYGPPTLLGSNFFDISNLSIDMASVQ